jgi:large subunit ribosomal protein L23
VPKELHPYSVIVRPLVTEKSTLLAALNKYAFEVMPHANKIQIKAAVEVAFEVRVRDVNTSNVHGKVRRFGARRTKGRAWKKAIVTLQEGYKIELFEGV